MHEEDAEGIAKYQCAKCGHASEWMGFRTTTEAKRGIPCPKCNVTEQGLSATELK
jgi:DNA-directed RNA polymerase subunit RPC12/RpoP